jgi:hypothetical protein
MFKPPQKPKKTNAINILDAVSSYKRNEQTLEGLVRECVDLWGEFYWLNSEFQKSSSPVIMERINTDIAYDLQKFNSFIFWN